MPCVASDVGANRDIIKDGVNGFLADSNEEWVEKLSNLIESHNLRINMGLAGRKTVEDRFSLKVSAPVFIAVITNIDK